jgi:hypothetical protein
MNKSFYRKIIYAIAIILLLFPILWLGAPSSRGGPGQADEPGGKLAQLRTEARLGQADLGAIDPASETIRLATLGMRGMAVTMLWTKANEYKKTEDWTAFQATLEQLARLQPYFIKVWQYQAWNLSYNVSVELDNVRDRFYYVKQGIEYLEQGIQYLRDNPSLLDDLGWFCGNKVGRADEHEQYRRLFKADDDLHPATRLDENRDNWLVSKVWYEQALSSVDDKKQPLGTKNPVTFFDSPARSQISYAEAIEDEGTFGLRAKEAWAEGDRLWRDYGNREMRSTQGFLVRLADQEKWEAREVELKKQLDALNPGLESKMKQEAIDSLTAEQRKMLDKMPSEPSGEEYKQYEAATEATNITPEKIAARISKDDPDKAPQARRLAGEIEAARQRANSISTDRDVANFDYWQNRCDLEQTPEALQARELAHAAHHAFAEADPAGAKKLYEQSFSQWAKALAQYPKLTPEGTMGGDVMDFIDNYNAVLQQLDISLADDDVAASFPLWTWLEANDQERKYAEAIDRQRVREGKKPKEPVAAPTDKGAKPLINPADAEVPRTLPATTPATNP